MQGGAEGVSVFHLCTLDEVSVSLKIFRTVIYVCQM